MAPACLFGIRYSVFGIPNPAFPRACCPLYPIGMPARFFLVVGWLAMAPALNAAEPLQVALIVHRVHNPGPVDAQNVVTFSTIPGSGRYQDLAAVRVFPAPASAPAEDGTQQVVEVPLGRVAKGTSSRVRIMIWTRPKAVELSLVAQAGVPELEAGDRQRFLADEAGVIERVRAEAERIAAGKTRDLDKARAFYEHIAEHCTYDINEHHEAADAVLAGKPASCSELAWTFVALCRAAGVPARAVSAYVNREPREISADWQTHCWAEFYATGIGWVPVDPTNRINYPDEHFFGRQQGRYAAWPEAPVDDAQADPGWHGLLAYREPGNAVLNLKKAAVWKPSTSQVQEAAEFQRCCAALAQADPVARAAAVRGWIGSADVHPGFLIDALSDDSPAVRKEAAACLEKLREPGLLLAVISLAEDEPDAEVKKAIIAAARATLALPDEEARAKAVAELAKSRTDTGLELLSQIAKDPGRAVRKAAAQMLYKFGDKPTVHENYRQLVKDPDDFVRVFAALRWARTGTQEVLPYLVQALGSRTRWDREKAFEELRKRAGQDFGYDPKAKPDSAASRKAIEAWRVWSEKK